MTEYGGMRFGSYFMAEYMEMLVVSGIAAAMFLGGWHLPFGIDTPAASTRSGCSPRSCC